MSGFTGKFYGFSKLSCWKTFNSSSPEVYTALESLGYTTYRHYQQSCDFCVESLL